jgi:cellulose synthase/poly-beta-1,6-N-acetylglucosamine synthase-like glycosyltransferase
VTEPTAIGFVVIGRNEGPRLERCLRSVLSESNRVVYADSASSDGSQALAERLGAAVVSLADDGRLNAARGRNAGFAELVRRFPECEAIQFLDGDCILQPGWIEKAVAFLRDNPKAAVVCGRRFEAHPDASMFNAMCDQEWNTPIGEAEASGGDALVRRSAFEQVGGYSGALRAGEEPEMAARMRAAGWQIWRIDAPMTEHDARILTLSQWWRRTQRGGYGYAQVWAATNGLPKRLYGHQLRSAFTWAVAIPLLIVAAAIITRQPLVLLLLPVAYGIQLMRNARYMSRRGEAKWANAGLLLLAKFAEASGAARFLFARDDRGIREYKANG